MECERAVEGAMLDFKTKFPLIDEECKLHVRYLLNLMWMVGWEHRAKEFAKHNLKPVQQLDRFGILLHTFPSLRDAAIETGYKYNSLQTAVRRGSLTHRGRYYWKYVQLNE